MTDCRILLGKEKSKDIKGARNDSVVVGSKFGDHLVVYVVQIGILERMRQKLRKL